MREVVSLHVGQTGVRVGDSLWRHLTQQHLPPRSDPTPRDAMFSEAMFSDSMFSDAMFRETSGGEYVARCVFTDLERGEVEEVKRGGHMYSPDSFIADWQDSASNYARGHYSIGRGLADRTVEGVRREVEKCESVQGILTTHSLGGGTGAGYTSLLHWRLRDMFRSKVAVDFALFPSPQVSPIIVEPYNSILYLNSELLYCDNLTVMLENESLYKLCSKLEQIELPCYPDINNVISRIISAFTAPVRHPGSHSVDLATIQTNIVPYSRLRFVSANLTTSGNSSSIADMTTASFSTEYSTLDLDMPKGKLLSACLLYRGLVTAGEVNTALHKLSSLRTLKTCNWVPCPFKVGILNQPHLTDPLATSLCTLTNHTGLETTFDRLNLKFDKLYQRRAFLHWFHGEGMESDEFACAREEVAALEQDYSYENNPPSFDFDRYRYKGEDSEDSEDESQDTNK